MTETSAREIAVGLINSLEGVSRSHNELDVQIECLLFKPGTCFKAIRPNAAGTKVIYTDRAGNNVTCWAEDWTHNPARRRDTANRLRAILQEPTP